MITTTVIAIALGIAPIDSASRAPVVSGNYDALVGRYSQTIDRRGTIHVRGSNPRTRAPYEVTIASNGDVEAILGDSVVNFRVTPAE